MLEKADHIVVTSPTTQTEFESITKKPVTVLTNGYDTKYQGGANLDKDFTISYIGSSTNGQKPKKPLEGTL